MANIQMTQQEEDIRLKMLNSFMSCPHRDTDKVKEIHEDLRDKDPLFYAHLACWYRKNQAGLRDHNEVFSAMLITDPYLENRETGLALFREHAPFMKSRILGFIKGKKVKIRTKTGKKKRVKNKSVDEVKIDQKRVGIGKTVPTSLKTEVKAFLRYLEADPNRFDSVALRNFKDLKYLYAAKDLRIKPSPRAQQILFEKKYPKDSKLAVFKEIMNATPQKAAKLIVEHKIPYTIAVGLIGKMTPSILVALINNMSSQEVINNISSLQDRGAFDNPKVKTLIEEKLEKAKKSKKVSTLKSKKARSTGRVKDEGIQKHLDEVTDNQVKKTAIKVPTAIFVDRSGSMQRAIEVGKQVATLVSGAVDSDLYVVAFDNVPVEVKAQGASYTAWEKAFAPIRAGGSTSIGCALDFLKRTNRRVEQIIVITDEGENASPAFASIYPSYVEKMGVSPRVIVIKIDSRGTAGAFSSSLKRSDIEFEHYKPDGNDYYGLPGLLPLLASNSKLDLIYEIMAQPVKTRKAFK